MKITFNYKILEREKYLNFQQNEKIKLINSQKELLKILAQGYTLNEIAKIFNCSHDNIKKRTKRLYKKFNAKNRKELIQKAIKLKFLGYKDISYKFRKRFLKKDINISSKINVPDNIEPLNESEMKIFNLAVKGYTKKEIVKELNLLNMHSCNVSFYIILRKLKAENITNAVCIAIKSGLIKI